jgi:hypothetical protein
MRRLVLVVLAIAASGAQPLFAQDARLDASRFAGVLQAARQYSEDRTLISYCLRRNDDLVPFLYSGLHDDIRQALDKLRAVGADDRQRAELVKTVLESVRFAARDTSDARLDRECGAKDVEKSYFELRGVSVPLFMRPPFDQIKAPASVAATPAVAPAHAEPLRPLADSPLKAWSDSVRGQSPPPGK